METVRVLVENFEPSDLDEHPWLETGEFNNLMKSIEEQGLLSPILAKKGRGDAKHQIAGGKNRWKAHKVLGERLEKAGKPNKWRYIDTMFLPDDATEDEIVEIIDQVNFTQRQYSESQRQGVLYKRFGKLIMAPKVDAAHPYQMPNGDLVTNKLSYIHQKTKIKLDTLRKDLADIGNKYKEKPEPRRWKQTLDDVQVEFAKESARKVEAIDQDIEDIKNAAKTRIEEKLERRSNLVKAAAGKIPGGIKRCLEMYGKKKKK